MPTNPESAQLVQDYLAALAEWRANAYQGLAPTPPDLRHAEVTGADLTDVDLRGANLTGAVLTGAELTGAVLTDVNLRSANLRGAVLTGADLTGAVLTDVNLRGTNLRGANHTGAVLTGAYLRSANLTGAVLTDVNLRSAVLTGADLTDVNLRSAVLTGADLTGAILPGGYRWEAYVSEVVPALLQAGGHPLAEVATAEHWRCHVWENCPIAAAFGAKRLEDVPALYRWEAEQFIHFFDQGLIPNPCADAIPSATVR